MLVLLFLVKSSEASFSVHNIIRCKFTNNYYIAQSFSLILPSSLNSSLFPLILPPPPYLSKRHLSEFKNAILASAATLDFVACQSKKAANIHNRWWRERSERNLLKRYLPKLSNGATIRPGNGPFALKKGSVAVGEYLMPGVVVKSSQAVASLCTRIKNQLARHAKVTLKIDGEEHGEIKE